HPGDLVLAICWHFVGNMVGILQTWVFFNSLGQSGSLVVAAAAWVLGVWFDLLAFAVPLNLGTLEGGRLVDFGALGSNALVGMTYGVTLRLAHLTCAGLGLIGYAFLVSGRERKKTEARRPIFEKLTIDS